MPATERKSRKLYDTLGVAASATKDEIKRAFRQRAKSVHPDAGGEPEAFHNLQRAYAILGNKSRRDRYDETGHEEIAPDNEVANALSIIQQAVGCTIDQLMAQRQKIAEIDVISMVRQSFQQHVAKATQERKEQERRLAELDDAQKRFRCKLDDNRLARMMGDKITICRNAVAQCTRDAATFERCLELLKDYSFDFQQRPSHPDVTMGLAFPKQMMGAFFNQRAV